MAVARVFGRVDGIDIIFNRNSEGDRWDVPVPFDYDCEYIVELYAEDEAGNVSYLTRALFTYDPKSLTLKVAPVRYGCELLLESYGVDINPRERRK